MILFKRIKFKNFLSSGNTPTEINFTEVPTTLIVGTNGSGKSTMLDALCFVLGRLSIKSIRAAKAANLLLPGSSTILEKQCVHFCADHKKHGHIYLPVLPWPPYH